MYSNAGPTPAQYKNDLPNYKEVSISHTNNYNNPNMHYINNQGNQIFP
jgi:hypothetical protein